MGNIPTNNIFKKLDKTTLLRFRELYFSALIINDSLSHYYDGRHYQLNVICGQLRSILFEKSSGNHPLLLQILSLIMKKPKVYASQENERGRPSKLITLNDLSLYKTKSSIAPNKELNEYHLEEFLELTALSYNKLKIPISQLITDYSNNFGGSHYSQKVPNYIVRFSNIFIYGQNALEHVIIQNVDTIKDFIFEIIRSTLELDYFVNLKLEDNKTNNDVCLLNYKLKGNSNGFGLYLSAEDKLKFEISDSLGNIKYYNFDAEQYYDKRILFNLELSVNQKYNTSIKVFINNDKIISFNIEEPFIFLNELHNHVFYINSFKGENQNYNFKIGDLFYFNETKNIGEKSDIFHHCKKLESFRTVERNEIGKKEIGEMRLNFYQ